MRRPSLMLLLAGAAGLSAVTNAVSAAGGAAEPKVQTRLGASIQEDMAARDRQAAQRGRTLDMREQAARATEERLRNALGEGQQRRPARGPAAAAAAEAEDPYADLARIYQAMRPNRAAPVFEQLAMDVQVEVAQRMRERSTALIMANMSPRGAAALTMAMARRAASAAGAPVPGTIAATGAAAQR